MKTVELAAGAVAFFIGLRVWKMIPALLGKVGGGSAPAAPTPPAA